MRAAQRAFFETALAGEAQSASRLAAAAPAPMTEASGAASVRDLRPAADTPAPARLLRPGSLLDIRV